jgi:hypothetical protein
MSGGLKSATPASFGRSYQPFANHPIHLRRGWLRLDSFQAGDYRGIVTRQGPFDSPVLPALVPVALYVAPSSGFRKLLTSLPTIPSSEYAGRPKYAHRDIHCFHGDQLGLVEEDLDQVCRCELRVLST